MLKNLLIALHSLNNFSTTCYHVNLRRNRFIYENCIILNNRFLSSKYLSHTSTKQPSDLNEENVENKIIYNTILNNKGFLQKKREEKLQRKYAKNDVKHPIPVSLKYIIENENSEPSQEEFKIVENNYLINLPYTVRSVEENVFTAEDNQDDPGENSSNSSDDSIVDLPSRSTTRWMNDYEKYTSEQVDFSDESEIEEWRRKYGTPDPNMPVSQVPCGGCGALLHCQDYSIPGYLPSEIFSNCDEKDLREIICQRCHFMKSYNTALSVTVDQDVYPRLLSKIQDTKSLVLLIADMTDLPCSVWPGILDIIGYRRPLFLVGNKVDLLWGDRRGWMEHALCSLRSTLPKPAAIKYCSLVSAKTGYGIEELITKLHNLWEYKGDVYLVGCTNVGKSTLFNALLQSDYCKVKAVDLIQRATTAPWPGTTLNLLKFPILRPEGWRLYLRTMRLQKDRMMLRAEAKLRKEQKVFFKTKDRTPPQLVGHIGRTFHQEKDEKQLEGKDNFSIQSKPPRLGLNPNDRDFAGTKWVYDTPGVLHHGQILDLLTTEEVTLTLPKRIIEPRTYLIKQGWSIFIAGLARIDYLEGNKKLLYFRLPPCQ
ncbi:nitric oxide-associated protein 1 isoform X2 [Halyomorpha halys]|uniref:nitric oxide-associated protein 1 isoform X2 n=1 Tax=Halyomorpha halys TaxID=286706 RepID=UPI0006D5072E|nr:nitric oxide-associated protein 1 isoform X2 [Halyomorpha halys]